MDLNKRSKRLRNNHLHYIYIVIAAHKAAIFYAYYSGNIIGYENSFLVFACEIQR